MAATLASVELHVYTYNTPGFYDNAVERLSVWGLTAFQAVRGYDVESSLYFPSIGKYTSTLESHPLLKTEEGIGIQ